MKKIMFILIVLFSICSCKEVDKTGKSKTQQNEIIDSLSVLKEINSDSEESQKILYIKSNSIVFFSLSKKEFNQFIHRTGQQSEWDFELIYKQFKKMAKNTKEALKNEKVHAIYTISPKIAFITEKGDTLFFDRKENDLFIGQIFFNGKDTLDIEEGLMKRDSMQNRITRYFNLKEDINIKQTVIKSVGQKLIKKDTTMKQIPDTLKTP